MSRNPQAVPLDSDDEQLILRAESGDRSAVTLLFERYSTLIFSIGLRILRDQGEAEDLVQEVFLGLFTKVKGFDPAKGAGRTWIVQIAYRRAFDRRAYLTRRSFYNDNDLERVKDVLPGNCVLQERILDEISSRQIQTAFHELSDKQRLTLEKYFFEGLSLREISEHTGERLENVRHSYYRGIERLRRSTGGGKV